MDECEVVHTKRHIITVRITDSEIAELKQNVESVTGVRLIHEKKILAALSTKPDDTSIIERAMLARQNIKPKNFWRSLPHESKFGRVEKTYDKRLELLSGKEAVTLAEQMVDSSTHQNVSRISGSLNVVSEEFEIGNTRGLYCSDKGTYISGTINADSDAGSMPVSGVGAVSCRTLDSFSPTRIGTKAREMCLGSINPARCETDKYSVIFEPYAMGEMLAFVFSSNFNLKTYSEKRSCFSGKQGSRIASEIFSLIDDPHFPDGIGSKPFDDEGTPTKTRYLVDSGVFSGTYSDLFQAFKEGTESTGNASRLGSPMGRAATPVPSPSPHNLVIKEGNIGMEEMIRETKKGLLVGRLWYTYSVNPERGDFSCTARSGVRIIENGKIVRPGRPVRIVHNLPILLENVESIGNNPERILQWSALPCVTPAVKVSGIVASPL
ncbi:MAG TPA: TldD/PmbA family protein [Candidatus Nitrosotalea sp.]|nr:TldD/PmbA family protein [Candidatus Nitrosotalea sp.]